MTDPTRAHGSIHLQVGTIDPLFCNHSDGKVSICITDDALDVWLTGTPDELHAFASLLDRLANEAARRLVTAPSPDVEQTVEIGQPTIVFDFVAHHVGESP